MKYNPFSLYCEYIQQGKTYHVLLYLIVALTRFAYKSILIITLSFEQQNCLSILIVTVIL